MVRKKTYDNVYAFQPLNRVKLGCTTFERCETLIQFEDVPILSVVQSFNSGFRGRCKVFHNDGTELAVVDGARIFPSKSGKKSKDVNVFYRPNHQVVEVNGTTVLELRRDGAGAVAAWAEIYVPQGILVKAPTVEQLNPVFGKAHSIAGLFIGDNCFRFFEGTQLTINGAVTAKIGIWICNDYALLAADKEPGGQYRGALRITSQ